VSSGVLSQARSLAADRRLVDGTLALLLTVMAQGQLPSGTSSWVRAAMLVTTGALAWRRQAPLLVAATVAASVAAMGLSTDPPSVFGEYLAVMLASYTVAEQSPLPTAVGGLLLLILGIVGHDWRSPEFAGVSGFVSDSTIPVVIWLVGRAVHVQRGRADRSHDLIRQLESDRAGLAEAAIAEERLRLARELHDVVTHSISVIVIQAQGAQRVLPADPGQATEALRVIEHAGRSTLTEMRRLLGLLRDETTQPRSPQPRLDELPHLIDRVTAAGLPVSFVCRGNPLPLDAGRELSAYRIVQEALTNSLKYAKPATAEVLLSWHDDSLELDVTDTGHGQVAATGGGRGLVGMRERMETYGGELETGPMPNGGFRVWCRIPAGEQQ